MEKNGMEKEKNKLMFEGEYLNGKKWNGKGKEYNDYGTLNFEGDYLKGERNGKGKEYYNDDKLKFEGEYLNGKRNGKGKEYYLIYLNTTNKIGDQIENEISSQIIKI